MNKAKAIKAALELHGIYPDFYAGHKELFETLVNIADAVPVLDDHSWEDEENWCVMCEKSIPIGDEICEDCADAIKDCD